MSRPIVALLLATSGLAGGIAACSESKSEPVPSHPTKTTAAPPTSAVSSAAPAAAHANANAAIDGKSDAGDGAQPTAADEPVTYDGPLIGALFGQTPIMSDMAWPKKDEDRNKDKGDKGAVRIGYIRQGQKVPVLPQPHAKSNCKDGWYELVQGGFVCGRYASLDLNHPKIKFAPHPPDLESSLPYQYGYNVSNGTPLYRTIPSREERLKLEPWLAPKPKKAKPVEPSEESVASYGDDLDAGVPLTLAKTTTTITATTTDPFGLGAEEVENSTPWYLRQYDGGKPTVTLDELRGEGPMARRMVKGFFVGLDKEMSEKGSKWWRTTNTLIAPFERIYVHKAASKFQGIWLDAADDAAGAATRKPTPDLCKPGSKSQVGIVTFHKATKYNVSASRKAVTAADSLARHTVLKLTGDTVSIDGSRYDETDEGWWVKASHVVKTNPGNPPKELAPGEKWIDVNLSTQTLVAFEGDKPVFATAVSTGREDKTNKEKNHKTPTGTWRVREKHIAATMDGDVASDGPYSIEDVPWIMYYSGSYAIHGAFWHNNFGRTRSHGCTNMAPADARALFNWSEPRMPDNWHGVWSTAEKPGTLIVVHE